MMKTSMHQLRPSDLPWKLLGVFLKDFGVERVNEALLGPLVGFCMVVMDFALGAFLASSPSYWVDENSNTKQQPCKQEGESDSASFLFVQMKES
jgi:hypothetical protein